MNTNAVQKHRGQVIWYDTAILPAIEPNVFDPSWLRHTDRLTGTSSGRNTAWFLRYHGRDLVLRHYWRGGMMGKLIKDMYLRVPVDKSRAMREFKLLQWMKVQDLPVPRPVAACFSPAGPAYRADLLMERIADAQTIADLLACHALSHKDWMQVGEVIARMHLSGVYHSDLNCRNILLDRRRKIWLIDFDKCERRTPGSWCLENVERLKRSLTKVKGSLPEFFWDETDFEALRKGYQDRMHTSC